MAFHPPTTVFVIVGVPVGVPVVISDGVAVKVGLISGVGVIE